jgi:hypothetical protein
MSEATMNEPLRRKRLQVHLSIAVMLMFAAGGIIWANVSEDRIEKLGNALPLSEMQ